jgi:hypothetical protein
MKKVKKTFLMKTPYLMIMRLSAELILPLQLLVSRLLSIHPYQASPVFVDLLVLLYDNHLHRRQDFLKENIKYKIYFKHHFNLKLFNGNKANRNSTAVYSVHTKLTNQYQVIVVVQIKDHS